MGKKFAVHYLLYRQSKLKILTGLLLVIATLVELSGISLIYPVIYLFLDLGEPKNKFLVSFQSLLQGFGLPLDKWFLISIILLLMFAKAILGIAYRYAIAISVTSYLVFLRTKLFLLAFNSEYGVIDSKKGRLLNAMTTQSETASSAMQVLFNMIQYLVGLVGIAILGMVISFKLFMIALLIGGIILFLGKFSVQYVKRLGKVLAARNESYLTEINQGIRGYRYLRAVGGEAQIAHSIHESLRMIKLAILKYNLVSRSTKSLTEPIVMVTMAAVLSIGIMVLGTEVAVIILMYLVLGRAYTRLISLVGELQSYGHQLVGVRYCENLIRWLESKEEAQGDIKWEELRSKFKFCDVSFYHGEQLVLSKANFVIRTQETTVLMGRSGSGKTTVLAMVLGLLVPQSGKILADDIDLQRIQKNTFRRHIGFVAQESILFNGTVRQNLSLRNKEINDNQLIEYIKEFDLETIFPNQQVDLDYWLDESTSNISGGEKQRLALIRELAIDPQILVLDEMTSNLDTNGTRKIMDHLQQLSHRVTILIATHDPVLAELADNVYHFEDGNVTKGTSN